MVEVRLNKLRHRFAVSMMSEIVTGVQQAEAKAAKIIENAQSKAEQIRRETEREARDVIQVLRTELLEEIRELKHETEKKAQTKARQLGAKAEQDAAALEVIGSKNMAKAIDLIVQAVYDLGGAEK